MGLAPRAHMAVIGALSVSSVQSVLGVTGTTLGIGVSPPQGRLHAFSEAADTIPTVFTTNDVIIGRAAGSGASSGAVFMRYDSTNNVGMIGALSPGTAWRKLVVGADYVGFQNASGVMKGLAPGNSVSQFLLSSSGQFAWSNAAGADGSLDTGLSRGAAGRVDVTNGSTGNGALNVAGTGSGNAQTCIIESVSANTTLNTGSVTTNSVQIPLDAVVIDVSARITTTITTAANWSLGVGGATTRYVNASATLTAGTTATGADLAPRKYAAATNTVITTNVNPGAGAIRVTVHYIKITAPTS